MSTTENRLREALTAAADLVQPREQIRRPAPRRLGLLLPVAVAAAVALVVVLTVVLSPGRKPDHAPEPAVPPAPTGPPAASSAKYFITGVAGGGDEAISIRDARTGQVTATFKSPPDAMWGAASATADPGTFYLGATASQTRLYRLRIDDRGHVRSLTPVATVNGGATDMIALAASPDGKRLAYPVNNVGEPYGPAEIDVLTLATGQRTVYRSSTPGRLSELSWAADGRHLAYALEGSTNGSDGLWVLDTHGGSDLLRGSHRVLAQSGFVGQYVAPVLSANGSSLYAIGTVGDRKNKVTRIVELDVRTGRTLDVLYEEAYRHASGNVQWSFTLLVRDPGGRSLLAVGGGHARRIAIATRTLTNVPFSGGDPNLMAW